MIVNLQNAAKVFDRYLKNTFEAQISKTRTGKIRISSQSKGAFTQSVLRGVIRRRLGYVINKNIFFIKKTTILCRVIRRGVNATLRFVQACVICMHLRSRVVRFLRINSWEL